MTARMLNKMNNHTQNSDIIVPLYRYQKQRVISDARFQLWRWSRQIGKSFTMSLIAVLRALETGRKQLMLSSSQLQSDELMAKVHQHAEATNIALGELTPEIIEIEGIKLTKRTAKLANNAEIITMPANARTARGFTGDLYLDEFAMHLRADDIWAAAFPSVTRGKGRLIVASTPAGKQNKFYGLHSNPQFEQSEITIYDAVADGYEADVQELHNGLDDEDLWRQEYLVEFLDETTAYLTYEMIQACEREDISKELPEDFKAEGRLYLGIDVGRRRDLTVMWLWELLGDVLWTRAVVELQKVPFKQQEQIAGELIGMENFARCCIDETGLGMQMAENLQGKFGSYKVEKVTFTSPVKQELAGGLRIKVEDQLVRIPVDNKIRNDWHRVKKIITAAGNIRFDSDSSKEGHSDRFWAAALGVHAANSNSKRKPRVIVAKVS